MAVLLYSGIVYVLYLMSSVWLPQRKTEVRKTAERYLERRSECCVCTYEPESNE